MYRLNQIIQKVTFLTVGSKKIKQSIIIGVSLLVSFLINFPRLLTLFNIVNEFGESFSQVSIKDIVVRFVYLTIFSWLVLQYNINWKYFLSSLPKIIWRALNILISILLLLIAINVFFKIYEIIVDVILTKQEQNILSFVFIVILIILFFISGILRYQIIHQEDLVEKELLKQQSLKNELEALKNQINPHFLFNSLNSLNSLIRDNKRATTFVNKLSFMYRYILQNGTEDLVTLKEELKFLESYIYLIKTRYRNRFDIIITILDDALQAKIPALSLQLLVENAVKHNEISENNPLLVKVYYENNYVIVENKIQPRTTFVDSTGKGLANLNIRYNMLINENIVISNKDNIFKIKLPLK